jgi:hypothetical protein
VNIAFLAPESVWNHRVPYYVYVPSFDQRCSIRPLFPGL